jgi:hypothetical protein
MLSAKKARHLPRKGKKKGGALSSLPPTLESVISATHTFRFSCQTAISNTVQNITVGNLAGAIGGIGSVVNTSVQCMASSLRVHRVTIWPPLETTNPNAAPELLWFSPITAMEKDESKNTLVPTGITVTKSITATPPKNSITGDWTACSSNSSQTMFGLINIAAGAVSDVQLSWTISNNYVGFTASASTAAVGSQYYLYLDGSTSHKLQPVGKPSTF